MCCLPENLYASVFQRIPDPAFIWKRNEKLNTIVLYKVNRAAYNVTKGGIEQYIDRPVSEVLDHNPEFIRDIETCMHTGNTIRKERLYHYKSTSQSIWLSVDIIRILPDTILVITKNIDSRVKLLNELEESEHLFRTVFEGSPDAQVLVDSRDRITQCNQAALKMMRCRTLSDFQAFWTSNNWFFPDGMRTVRIFMENKSKVVNRRVLIKRNANDVFPAMFSAIKLTIRRQPFLYCHLKDISEYEKVCSSLEEISCLHQTIIRQMKDGLVYTDEQNLCKLINRAAADMLNLHRKTCIDEPLEKILSHPQVSTLGRKFNPAKLWEQCKTSGKTTALMEIFADEGKIFEILYSRFPRGKLYQFRDVSSDRQLHIERKKLERVEKMSRIAGQIAHDFNNLLSPLVSVPELIRKYVQTDERIEKLLSMINSSARQMLHVNTQLMSLTKRNRMVFQTVQLNDLIEKIVWMDIVPDNIELKLDLDSDLPEIMGDDAQLIRAVLNLVMNAVEAITELPGIVLISSRVVHGDTSQRVHLPSKGPYVAVTISDTGHGVDPAIKEKIFDPFVTTKEKPTRMGSGLGLNISKEIVEDHGGTLCLLSSDKKGSTFAFYIPVKGISRQD